MKEVGIKLAGEIATLLEQGLTISYTHRDYCGIGLRFSNGIYICDESHDGQVATTEELLQYNDRQSIQRLTFDSRSTFVEWLGSQTDPSLSGSELKNRFLRNNQRLTVQRLEDVVARCQNHLRKRWDGQTLG